ncbi:restriction endonuclease subunit S [Luteimonas soli]|uniref:Restriction endonuclease subunit S n=1 Tax=Luteimonas soli TaxID=1648966 RepID=A0ABV7XMQ0_9GAMM
MSWLRKPLAQVADLCLGKMLDEKKNKGDPMPYLANVNVRWGEFDLDSLREMRFEPNELDRYGLKHGDIVMCEGGEPGRCAIWKDEVPGMMIQKALHRIRPGEELDYRFLYYSFLYKGRNDGFSGLFTGSTIKHLPGQNLAKVEVRYPSRPEQERIADTLSAYDDLIENNRRRIKLLEESARLLYREWFVHLRFPGHEHVKVVDGVPVGWERKFVPDLIAINPKERIERGKEAWYVPMAALSETGMTVDRGDFERRTVHTTVKFRTNDVLLARITPCLENGKTGFVYFLDEGDIACGSTEFIVLRGTSVSPYFVYCLARTYDFREHAIKSMIGSSGRQRVQVGCFDEYWVALPPSSQLSEFDGSVAPMFKQIAVLDQQIERLGQARDLLLPHLMSGDVVSSTESLEAT